MNSGHLVLALRYLRRLAGARENAALTDHHLLERYVQRRDEAAFAALVQRHGGMVWGVCRRVLADSQDADDAFQATFLVLIHKAAALSQRESLAGFLQSVAWRLARRVKADAARRQVKERHGETERIADPVEEAERRDLRALLDAELDRLPEKYRAPLVLCYLEGLTYTEAARRLGWRDGTVCGRLARGRELLRKRLSRRGLALSGAALLATLTEPAAAPAASVAAVLRTAALFALGQSAGIASTPVITLAQGVLHTMTAAKLKMAAALIVTLCVCAAGVGLTAQHFLAMKPAETLAPADTPPEKPKTKQAKRTDLYGDPLPPGAVARMGSVRLRHFRAHIAFAADSKTLISGGPDRRVCAWDVATGRLVRGKRVRSLTEHGFLYFDDATLSADGKTLVVNDGKTVYLHNAVTGEERGRISSDIPTGTHFSLSADGKTLALLPVVTTRDVLHLWDTSTGKECCTLKHKSAVGNFVFSADGKLLASSTNGVLHLWDTSTGAELRNVRGEGRSLAFAPDGKLLAAGDNSGVTLWETATLNRQATLKPSPGINRRITSPILKGLAFSPDGSLLAVAGYEALVLWDVAERKERRRLPDREAHALAFAPDGKTLACAGEVEIRLWDVATGRQLQQRPGHDGEVASLSVSPDGKILASADWNQPLRLWDAATGKPLGWQPTGQFRMITSAFSPDGNWLICGGDGRVQFWDIATGKERRRFVIEDLGGAKGKHEVWKVALSTDGQRLTALSLGRAYNKGLQLNVWDTRTGQSIARRPYRGPSLSYSSVLSPDGKEVIVPNIEPERRPGTQSDGPLTLEDTVTGQPLLTIPRKLGYPLVFSPDGKLLAAGIHHYSGDQVKGVSLTETATGEEVLRIDRPLSPVVFSPDGRLLASIDAVGAVGNGGLRIWDVATGQRLFRRAWPDDAVRHPSGNPANSLAFLPGGRRLATGMTDGTVLVWDLAPETWPKTNIARHLDRKQLDAAWSDLAGDARKAHRAIYTLAESAEQALPFLAEHLRPAATVDAQRVEKLLADLDSERFTVREAAAKELIDMGTQIEPALRRVLESKPPLEVRKRVRAIQEALRGVPPTATLRTLRALRVLETIANAEARQLLGKLASGAAEARETREAKAALDRLTVTKPSDR